MQAAQESAVARTVALIESKAQGFVRAMRDLDAITAERDEETRSAGEQQVWGGVEMIEDVWRCESIHPPPTFPVLPAQLPL